MSKRFQAPRGTLDILPAGAAGRDALETAARELFQRAGYGRIETPAFEVRLEAPMVCVLVAAPCGAAEKSTFDPGQFDTG